MISVAEFLALSEDPLADLVAADVPIEFISSVAFVTPSAHLCDFRFGHVGQEIESRLGLHLKGMRFGELQERHFGIADCLIEFQTAASEVKAVSSHRNTDFSPNWVIEYSRTIVPILRHSEVRYLLAGYVFHDRLVRPSAL